MLGPGLSQQEEAVGTTALHRRFGTFVGELPGPLDQSVELRLALLPIGYPVWLGLNLCLALALGLNRRIPETLILLLPVVLGFGYLRNYIGLNKPTPSAGIRVLTFNVKYFDRYRLKLETREARQQRVDEDLKFIGDSNPDIFCGQDFCSEDLTDAQLFEKVRAHTGRPLGRWLPAAGLCGAAARPRIAGNAS